jgi:DNA-binding NtrC family response regulator
MHVRGSKMRVLVVDDERSIADSLALILNQSGYEARAAYSGESAVKSAAEWLPHVLISDVVMSGMTGIEASIAVLKLLPSCKVILFSGQARTVDFDSATKGGYHFEILAKPVHPQALLKRLTAIEKDKS